MVLMLAPLAPHIAEELWARLGHADTLAYEPTSRSPIPRCWSTTTVEVPVQVNGKVRGKVTVATGAAEADARSGGARRRQDRRAARRRDGPQGHRRPRPHGQLRRRLSPRSTPRPFHAGRAAWYGRLRLLPGTSSAFRRALRRAASGGQPHGRGPAVAAVPRGAGVLGRASSAIAPAAAPSAAGRCPHRAAARTAARDARPTRRLVHALDRPAAATGAHDARFGVVVLVGGRAWSPA